MSLVNSKVIFSIIRVPITIISFSYTYALPKYKYIVCYSFILYLYYKIIQSHIKRFIFIIVWLSLCFV
ncbi:hypothetical protein BDC45DRAFT_208492 [Circinella umbellata]|nr:hypothetical protein BDC45DRAFT_208492 [Circinella umbellata]